MKQDDRTEEQKKEYTYLIGGRDSCLSGWGLASNGSSYAYWACKKEDVEKVLSWVSKRSDMRNVGVYRNNPPYKASRHHVHVYMVEDGHPALS
jgi:hypothetical protein